MYRSTTPPGAVPAGQLYHCLQKHIPFDEALAFPTQLVAAA
ncbi:hypothetical protein QFZ82_007479 [Streptomyces sp. V4I23]|nr:hypothetical protein [Streptomyces sp. V4I23]MDQ1012994.1 hypothetical protein [Streptomyces sp. V4I23]